MDPTPSSISLYWIRLFGAKILLCGYKVAGLSNGSPPTARALNCPHCRKKRDEAHLLYAMGWGDDFTARRESLLPVPILDFFPDGV